MAAKLHAPIWPPSPLVIGWQIKYQPVLIGYQGSTVFKMIATKGLKLDSFKSKEVASGNETIHSAYKRWGG